jgi:membrane protein implicated in regulation of membrane protease activity
MRRWETLTALAAVVAASLGALRTPLQWWFTAAAFALLGIICASLLARYLNDRRR